MLCLVALWEISSRPKTCGSCPMVTLDSLDQIQMEISQLKIVFRERDVDQWLLFFI